MSFVARLRLLFVTVWVGSLWTIGYIVAPTLFSVLSDRVLAGTIAGRLFRIEAWISLACALALAGLLSLASRELSPAQRKTSLILIIGMLACSLIGYFGLSPLMTGLREAAGPGGVMASESRMQFGILHGISSGLYLVQSLLGAWLIFRIR
jgi:hypothetical protein